MKNIIGTRLFHLNKNQPDLFMAIQQRAFDLGAAWSASGEKIMAPPSADASFNLYIHENKLALDLKFPEYQFAFTGRTPGFTYIKSTLEDLYDLPIPCRPSFKIEIFGSYHIGKAIIAKLEAVGYINMIPPSKRAVKFLYANGDDETICYGMNNKTFLDYPGDQLCIDEVMRLKL